ncbi:flagellar basal-body rod protein FlgF [Litorivita pollutaquae]|uniref:Flagellar basal-body rod protein FlgF n=1 Tax=Litorivita pollutaquae TaxID=2200892 RepID=A0A2V4MP94_9RHOB|nr:flagellar hook-basal body complex protein [Litorivita pollutaquae]PYC47369.1 flagellar basal-body rod protein FlgF [Litorivita pollutaquae]
MENATYTTLTRQTGLMREMQIVANNIANAATTGFRQEGLVFGEYVKSVEGEPSISMATGNVRMTSMMQGGLTQTGGQFDFGIEGEGFFLIETPQGERLTRNGSFSPSAEGDLVTNDGFRVLDAGGAPIFIPPDATDLSVAADGTVSSNGKPLSQIGIVQPIERHNMVREDGVMFLAEAGHEPAENASVLQGFLESSNVDSVGQIARMIEVQRAYEMGQSFLDAEDERMRNALKTFLR